MSQVELGLGFDKIMILDIIHRLNNLAKRLVKKEFIHTQTKQMSNFLIVQVEQEQDLSLKSQTPLWLKYLVKSVQ